MITIYIAGSIFTVLVLTIVILLVRNSQLKEKAIENGFQRLHDKMDIQIKKLDELSHAEFEVIKLYADGTGKTAKEIAFDLFKSENKIKKQISSAFKKLGVKKRSQLEALIRNIVKEEHAKS